MPQINASPLVLEELALVEAGEVVDAELPGLGLQVVHFHLQGLGRVAVPQPVVRLLIPELRA